MEKKFKDISNSEDGLLTAMFRKVLTSTGLMRELTTRINKYVKKDGAKAKGSILSVIHKGEMSWKSFIFLLTEILEITKIEMSLKLTHKSGVVTTTEIVAVTGVSADEPVEKETDVRGNKKETRSDKQTGKR